MGNIIHMEDFRKKVVVNPRTDENGKKHTLVFLLSINNSATQEAIDKMADALVYIHEIPAERFYEMIGADGFSNISNEFTREEAFNYTSLSQFFYSYNEIMLIDTCGVLFGIFTDLPHKLSIMSLAWNKYLQASLEWNDDKDS